MSDGIETWMNGYLRAWDSNDPDEIRAIFTEDATYRTRPHAEPWTGHQEIVAGWLDVGDSQGDHSFEWHSLARDGALHFVRGETVYASGDAYSNLWVVRLAADGRATDFTEWWMECPPGAR
jgi:ketosteroid isomerase-like protein